MITAYWVGEYVKVFLAYFVLMFLYPSILFRSYLKGKSRTFWFGFCLCSSIMLISSVVLILGLAGLLNVWMIRLLFYGSLGWCLWRMIQLPMSPYYFVYKVKNHTYGHRLIVLRTKQALKKGIGWIVRKIRNFIRGNALEMAALAALMIYALVYFAYGSLTEHYYGFGDMYVHHSWIYGLVQGRAFSGKIYPEAMHCVVYAMYALFGIRVYSVMLYLQCVHVISFLICAYLLMRELFAWKYTGLAVLAAFLSMKLECVDEIYGMSRLQWTIPQEFALFTVFLIPLCLVRYLKHAGRIRVRGWRTKLYWNSDLLLFMLGISASFATHFYCTIMAVFSCLGVAVIWMGRLVNWRRLIPVVSASVLAIVLAGVPMVLALVQGVQLQGSLYWAINVMNGEYNETESSQGLSEETQTERGLQKDDELPILDDTEQIPEGMDYQRAAAQLETSIPEAEGESVDNGTGWLQRKAEALYRSGYATLYTAQWGKIFMLCSLLPFALWIVYRFLAWIWKHLFHVRAVRMELFDGYVMIAVVSLICMSVYAGPQLGIPELVAGSRLCTIEHMFLLSLLAIPVDVVGCLLAAFCGAYVMQGVGVVSAAAVFAAVVMSGNYHGYLYFEGSRYKAAVEVTNSIISSMPQNQFTIVSTTDELYQIIEYGFHEEYLTLLARYTEDGYFIPTKYVFFFVEKEPLKYGQSHFLDGPEWLALERYCEVCLVDASQCPQMLHGELSDDKAAEPLVINAKQSEGYSVLSNREIVESAAAVYLRGLQRQYPNEMRVYYEDDSFLCYCLEQNVNRLFNIRKIEAEGNP